MMKKWMIAGLFVVSSLIAEKADAATFNFTYFGRYSGGYTMVSCDYAERQAIDLFRLYGARNIRVSCSGGIWPNGTISPLSLRVQYTPVAMTEDMQTTREYFRSDSRDFACDFNSRLVRQSVRKMQNVKIVRANDACFPGSGRFDFTFSVKLPN